VLLERCGAGNLLPDNPIEEASGRRQQVALRVHPAVFAIFRLHLPRMGGVFDVGSGNFCDGLVFEFHRRSVRRWDLAVAQDLDIVAMILVVGVGLREAIGHVTHRQAHVCRRAGANFDTIAIRQSLRCLAGNDTRHVEVLLQIDAVAFLFAV
jgi:hypothetical protein